MKTQSLIIFCISLCISCKGPKNLTADGGKQIFHEPSSSWTTTGDAEWLLSDGILSASDAKGFAITSKPYDDFILEAEFMPDEVVNSGIFLRCNQDKWNPMDCYEINIADNHQNQDFRTGAIVTKAKPIEIVNSVGQWNKYKIKANGNHIQVWLNGVKTGDIKDESSAKGLIGLQLNGNGRIQFRNVRIREL